MLDEDLLLMMAGPAARMSRRDIFELLQIATFTENENLISMTTGPVAEMKLLHTKIHTKNEERSKDWPIKGPI